MKLKGIVLTMLSSITFGFAFTLGPMTYGAGGSNPVTLTFLRNFLSLPFLLLIVLFLKVDLRVTKNQLKNLAILGFIGNYSFCSYRCRNSNSNPFYLSYLCNSWMCTILS